MKNFLLLSLSFFTVNMAQAQNTQDICVWKNGENRVSVLKNTVNLNGQNYTLNKELILEAYSVKSQGGAFSSGGYSCVAKIRSAKKIPTGEIILLDTYRSRAVSFFGSLKCSSDKDASEYSNAYIWTQTTLTPESNQLTVNSLYVNNGPQVSLNDLYNPELKYQNAELRDFITDSGVIRFGKAKEEQMTLGLISNQRCDSL